MNISGIMLAMQGAVSQGVLWGIMVLGVYITYKILDIADLTVDGSFALGGCICAVLVVDKGMDPLLALVISTLAGMLAGAVTGLLHTLFDIPAILAGILTQIGLWSINLRIMGKSNVPLLKVDTIFSRIVEWFNLRQTMVSLVIGILIGVLVIVFLYWLFGTEIGCALRATGNNEDMVRALGIDAKMAKLLALTISNGLVGLAAIVIGDVLMGKLKSFGSKLASAVIGSVVYFLIRAIVLQLGMDANDMKLLSAVIVALALCIPVAVGKWRIWKAYSEEGPTC